MADIDDGNILGRQLANDPEEPLCVVLSQDGCRFVQNQNVSFSGERFGDLHPLAVSDGEHANTAVHVKAPGVQ